MNLDNAVAAHAEWKVKLRSAIETGERLDAASIGKDNCCELGRWLHGDARRLLNGSPGLTDCIAKHAAFHCEAGRVAEAINARQFERATAMLEAGQPYASASSAVGVALHRMKRELATA